MKRCVTLLLLFFECIAYGQENPYAREIVSTLASPAYKGRGYVQNGNKKAADFIIQQYKQLGLRPFGTGYRQPFGISVNTFPGSMDITLDGKKLAAGRNFLIDPGSPPVKGSFKLVVVPEQDLADSLKLLIAIQNSIDKFLVIDQRNSGPQPANISNKISKVMQSLKMDKNLKLQGLILFTNDKLTWGISAVQNPRPVIVVNSEVAITESSTLVLNIQSLQQQITTSNLTGFLPGTTRPDSFLVITAHYDHLGKMGRNVYFPGANDNASGVAMMLNLARYFSLHPPEYSVVFIALSAEELGLVGSLYFVNNPVFDLKKIKFLVNFDLAGTGEEGIKVVNGAVFPKQFALLKEINDSENLLKSVQVRGPACNSDHCPFYSRGVPCFYIYTLGGIKAYHDIEDRAQTLPLTLFNEYFKLMTEFFTRIL